MQRTFPLRIVTRIIPMSIILFYCCLHAQFPGRLNKIDTSLFKKEQKKKKMNCGYVDE